MVMNEFWSLLTSLVNTQLKVFPAIGAIVDNSQAMVTELSSDQQTQPHVT